MKDNVISKETPIPRFLGQWNAEKRPSWAQTFTKPTCTIPDQSMSIQEIIAKFTRTGLVPESRVRQWDAGGNDVDEYPEDPLDDFTDIMKEVGEARSDGSRSGDQPEPAGGASPAPSQGEGEAPPVVDDPRA